jgi:hypothetical protein
VNSTNIVFPFIVIIDDQYRNWLCFKFFQNISVTFVVRECVFCGFLK